MPIPEAALVCAEAPLGLMQEAISSGQHLFGGVCSSHASKLFSPSVGLACSTVFCKGFKHKRSNFPPTDFMVLLPSETAVIFFVLLLLESEKQKYLLGYRELF